MTPDEAPHWTLQTLLRDILRFGNRPALIAVRGEAVNAWTFAELAEQASGLASGLIRQGVAVGEPILLMGQSSRDWVVVRLALGAIGALAVPCDHLSTPEEIERLVADCGCRRAFVDSAYAATVRNVNGGTVRDVHVLTSFGDERVVEDGPPSWRALTRSEAAPLPPLHDDAPAVLVYTSGTTGAPKSFTLSSANIAANVHGLVAERLLGPDDRVLLPLPLHHIYPFVVGLLVPLTSGVAVVFPEGLAGPQVTAALRLGGVTTIVGVPRLYAALDASLMGRVGSYGKVAAFVFERLLRLSIALRRRFGWHAGRAIFRPLLSRVGPSLRLLVSGGSTFEESLIWRLEGLGWTVRSGYGLAETASTFTGNLPGRERIGSEGRPFQGGEVRISGPDAAGTGEIQLRGPNVFEGYRHNLEANREAFSPDGWFCTGDLGCLDDNGYLYFKGRRKDLIVLGGGKNVFPEDLERAYGASPFIQELAVLERAGTLHALVLPDEEAIRQSGTARIGDSVRVALSSAAHQLPSYQRLAGYTLVREPLPRTRLGKYRRFLLPDIYERALAGTAAPQPAARPAEDRTLLAQPLAQKILHALESRYGPKSLDLDASLQLDLGIDSLEWITLGLELERRIGVVLSEAELATIDSVRDLITAAQRTAGGPREGADQQAEGAALAAKRVAWIQPDHIGHRTLAAALFVANWLLMRALFRLRREGPATRPRPEGLVFVANHASDLDPLALAAALPFGTMRRLYWGGDVARLFSGPLKRFMCRVLHIFPVDETAPAASLDLATHVLKAGNVLVWFPESWRSPTGEVQRFLPGIGSLIAQSGAMAVPAYIQGSFDALPRWSRVPRLRPIVVRFGEPLTPGALDSGDGEAPAQRITRSLERALAALAPPAAKR